MTPCMPNANAACAARPRKKRKSGWGRLVPAKNAVKEWGPPRPRENIVTKKAWGRAVDEPSPPPDVADLASIMLLTNRMSVVKIS